ncbi:hypothetical protein [uncultured Stenotrophomonas sp.]|uniref:hypothetical protein n=1 Tax=uncultured Stenotrophomonas sp. TaxID=165438 RepID=UPI0026000D63|nr:hypothetical protein [uncultured Stenotrophomonas sp.]
MILMIQFFTYQGGVMASFVQGVLSSRKQRQRFFYFRSFITIGCGIAAFKLFDGDIALLVGLGGLVVGYFTVAPVVAFLICFFEQLLS